LGKLTGSIQYLSGFEPETPWIVVWAIAYLLICMLSYNTGERKQDTFHTQLSFAQEEFESIFLIESVEINKV
jgi:hypothetical protein